MVSRIALMFVLHVIFMGVWFARRPKAAHINYWWKPALYLLSFYIFCGIVLSLYPSLTFPSQ